MLSPRYFLALALLTTGMSAGSIARPQWTPAEASQWYDKQPWLVGANYTTSTAVNQIEMWSPDTFDPNTIDRELGYASAAGMNTLRVFLHNLLWENDADGFKERLNTFLDISAKHHIKILFVIFDSDWDPNPVYGPQKAPRPGIHNSRWVQAPGESRLKDQAQYPKLQAYVTDIICTYSTDERVLGWDLWNEPNNPGGGSYPTFSEKNHYVALLLPQVYTWARSCDPVQPLTSGLWREVDWSQPQQLDDIEKIQLGGSDIISFHHYSWPESFEARVQQLKGYGRPLMATEYMGRSVGSTFDGTLPLGKKLNIAMYNWGLVDGKTQTRFPWDSWVNPYIQYEPLVWFHDVFHANGTPYRQVEVELIQRLSQAPKGVTPTP